VPLRSLRAACTFLNGLELVEELNPADVAVFAFQAGTAGTVVGRCYLAAARGLSVLVVALTGFGKFHTCEARRRESRCC